MSVASHVHRGLEILCSFEFLWYPIIQCARIWEWFIFTKREIKNTTAPTITRRARRLSVYSSENEDHMTFCEQEKSLWFKLPRELREEVYKHYIGETDAWIVLRNDGIIKGFRSHPIDDIFGGAGEDHAWRSMDVLPLLTTCRKIYIEAIPALYTLPHFLFINPPSFLIFSSSILPSRWDLLRNVTLDFLPDLCPDSWKLQAPHYLNQELHFSYLPTALPHGLPTPWTHPTPKAEEYLRKQLFFTELPRGKDMEGCSWYQNTPYGKKMKATFWSTCCKVLENMNGMHELNIWVREMEMGGLFDERMFRNEPTGLEAIQLLNDVHVMKDCKSPKMEVGVIRYCGMWVGCWWWWEKTMKDGVADWKVRQAPHVAGCCRECI